MPSTGQLCSRLIVLLCPLSLSLCVPGHRSLWTGSRLLQRWRIHQVTVFKFVVSNSLHSTSLLDDCTVKSVIRAHWQTFRFPVFSSANKCLLKVATYAAQLEQYLKAIEIYEQVWWSSPQPSSHVTCHHWLQGAALTKQTHHFVIFQVGTHAMDSTLLKYSAKDHFFKAALCHFCVDMLNAKVSRYAEFVCVRYTSRSFTLMFVLLSRSSPCRSTKKCFRPFRTLENANCWR